MKDNIGANPVPVQTNITGKLNILFLKSKLSFRLLNKINS